MSSSTVSADATSASPTGTATAFTVGSVLAVLGSVGYMSANGEANREAFNDPVGTVGCMLATAGAVVLALALARWRTTLPTWALLTASANLLFVVADAWFAATGIHAISTQTTNEEFDRLMLDQPWVLVMLLPHMVLGLVSYISLGVAGWRQRSLPRASSVLLVLAGLASVWGPFPPSLLLASAALFIASRSRS